jgi:hypothetical protein
MGKWQERYLRLDVDSLKVFSADGGGQSLEEFPIDEIERMNLEAKVMNFICQGRKQRLRDSKGDATQDWYSQLQAFMDRSRNPPPIPPPIEDYQAFNESISKGPTSPKSKTAPVSPPGPVQGSANKSRVEMMYEAHKKKLSKLQDQREKEARDLEDEFKKNTRARDRGKIKSSEVTQTAERLFNEHKFIKQRLDKKRQAWESKEDERIAETRLKNLPTRQMSDPALLTAREAGDRLYSDAERRELWRTQARDAQAKQELTMVTIGVRSSGAGPDRCHDLHKEAASRREKHDQAKQEKDQKDIAEASKDAVPCGDGRRGANLARLDLLYQEHKERSKKVAQSHSEAVMREQKEIEKHQVGPRLNQRKVPLARRHPPPWKDPNYPFNLPKKGKETAKDSEKEAEKKKTNIACGLCAGGDTGCNFPALWLQSLQHPPHRLQAPCNEAEKCYEVVQRGFC